MQGNSGFRRVIRLIRNVVGQKQFYRAARLLMYEAQFDVLNDPADNGEAYLQRVVLACVSNPIVFDVGANIGDWSAMLLANQKPTKLYAFEPCPGTFEILKRRGLASTLVPAACSDRSGKAFMSVTAVGAGTNSLTDSKTGAEVPVVALDDYCREHHIPHIDLLKIDAEGYDFNVLSGAQSLLASHAVEVLQFEYNHRWIGNRKLLKDAFDLLIPLGYQLGKLSGDSVQLYPAWHWEMETYREANFIAWLPVWQARLRTVPARWLAAE